MQQVALLIESSNAYVRGVMRGIVAYIREHRPWSLYLAEHSRGDQPPHWLRRLALGIHGFNPERHVWTHEDDKLLGTRPDEQIALFLGTTLKAVLHRRARYKIPACPQQVAQQRRRWSEYEDHVVRTLASDQAAGQLNRKRENILARRRSLGIRQIIRRAWSAGEDALFTQFNDDEIAQKTGRTLSSVENRRFRLDVRVPKPGWRYFTPEEDALLGTATDAEIAKRLGRNPSSVQAPPP